MAKISSALKHTLLTHPEIMEVHFNGRGDHFLNVYPHKGEQYGRITSMNILNPKTNKPEAVKSPILETRIVESVMREQILELENLSDDPNSTDVVDLNGEEKKETKAEKKARERSEKEAAQ